jgi:hypothetical protein
VMIIFVATSYARFYLNDPWSGGPYLLERLSPSGYMAIWGLVTDP